MIDAVSHETKTLRGVLARPHGVDGKNRRSLGVGHARGDDAVDRGKIIAMSELAGDAHEIGEIELTDPQHVDPGDRGDGLDVTKALVGLDLRNEQRPGMQRVHLAADVSALVIVMREPERGASAALRWVTRARNVILRLGRGADHGYHHAERADVQRPGDEMILAARHADHRHERESAT